MSTTAFMLLCPLRSNAAILRLPFELWPLADIVTNIIITGEADDVDSEV